MSEGPTDQELAMPDEEQSKYLQIILRTMMPSMQEVFDPERKDQDASTAKVLVWLCIHSHLTYHEKTKRGRRLITAMQQTQSALDFVLDARDGSSLTMIDLVASLVEPVLEDCLEGLEVAIPTLFGKHAKESVKEASRKVMAAGVLKAVFPYLARSMGAQKAAFWVGQQVAKMATEYEAST